LGESFNKVILIGHLGNDPEVRTLENGTLLCRFSIATTEVFKKLKSGVKSSHTEWHNIILWRDLAEISEKYLHKGDKVLIEGRIKSRSWKDKETGQIKYKTEIIANSLQMMGTKKTDSVKQDKIVEPNLKSFIKESSIDIDDDLPF